MQTNSIFLSHTWSDKHFARRLSSDLKKAGANVWLDEAEIGIGDSLIEKIREGIDTVDYLAVILSPEAVASNWVQKEVDIAMNQEIKGKKVKVLPLLYKKCSLPWFLEGKLYADFTLEKNYPIALEQVLSRLGVNKKICTNNKTLRDLQGTWVGSWLHKGNKRSSYLEVNLVGAAPSASMKISYWKNSSMTIINQILEVSSDSKGGVKLKGTGYVFEKQGDATGWHLDDFTGKINGGIFKGTKTDSKGRSSDFEFRRHNKDFVAIDLGASSIAVATSVQEEYIHHVDMDALLTDIRDVSEKHARSAFINSKIGLKKPKK